MALSPILGRPLLDPGQAGNEVRHNDDIYLTSVLLSGVEAVLATPPAHDDGKGWLIADAGATGDWAGLENQIAVSIGGAWQFVVPAPGLVVFVNDTERFKTWDGTRWERGGAAISYHQFQLNLSGSQSSGFFKAGDLLLSDCEFAFPRGGVAVDAGFLTRHDPGNPNGHWDLVIRKNGSILYTATDAIQWANNTAAQYSSYQFPDAEGFDAGDYWSFEGTGVSVNGPRIQMTLGYRFE